MVDTYVILGFSLLLIIGFGVIMLLIFRVMSRMSGNSLRADAAERRDHLQAFERIMEKAISGRAEMIAQVHRDERMNQINNDAEVAKAAIKGESPSTPISDLPRDELLAAANDIDVQGGDGSFS